MMKTFRLVLAYPFMMVGASFAAIGAFFIFIAEAINGSNIFEVESD